MFAIKQNCLPIAPHVFYTSILEDTVEEQRRNGMAMGLELLSICQELLSICQELWAFGDKISAGMMSEIEAAEQLGIPVVFYSDKCQRRILKGGE
ncbi:DUF4406 domain-containing protein [Desulfosporosinus acidiphilus]|uniref:DUF7768 domain-containing protein n=1 Tax=Desulfosporosinus acidiphilus TaxID=885581 RepID=UPI000257A767|nr:DUF4406 domain-containing protein [Desulfosporosinus acidiphilus]